jgi:hypothetical protein
MMKNPQEYYKKTEEIVSLRDDLLPTGLSEEELSHVSHIAASVMLTRDGIMPGGSFVQAICKNDLSGAFNRADHTNIKCIGFYVWVHGNVFV